MKGYSIVYFGGTDWSFRWQPQQYICSEIARQGNEVLFVENTGVRWPTLRDTDRVLARLRRFISTTSSRVWPQDHGVRPVPVLALPTHPSALLRRVNRIAVEQQVRRAARHLEEDRTICWIGLPNWTALDVSRALRPAALVYYCGEEFAKVPQAHPSIRDSERQILAQSDLVFATSRRLQILCAQSGRPVIAAPAGIDLKVYRDAAARRLPKPIDLQGLPGRLIGYVGGLNHKVDLPLLEGVIAAFQADSVAVLGKVEDPRMRPAPAANLHMLGERPYASLPAYIQHFDVCLIPYVRNDFTDSMSPAKLNDYLAAGKSVVSTALPEVLPFGHVVRIADGTDSFISQVRDALAEIDSPDLRAARVAAAATRSYDLIVPAMLASVEEVLSVGPRLRRHV